MLLKVRLLLVRPAFSVVVTASALAAISALAAASVLATPGASAKIAAKAKPSAAIRPQPNSAPSKAIIDLSESEIFDKLTGTEWFYPGDYWNIANSPTDNRGTVIFDSENCKYPANQTWLPGRKIEVIISGVSTAGTVRINQEPPPLLDIGLSKLKQWSEDSESARKFPYQSVNGITSLKWNFRKNDKRGGFIFLQDGSAVRFILPSDGTLYLAGHKYLPRINAKSNSESTAAAQSKTQTGNEALTNAKENNKTSREQLSANEGDFFNRLTAREWIKDSSWKVERGSTPPQQIKFTSDGQFNVSKDEHGNWIEGPRWSLINRDGMHIVFHPTGPFYKSYSETSALEPKLLSDHELSLILHVPTYTKYGDKLFEHRFIANKTK